MIYELYFPPSFLRELLVRSFLTDALLSTFFRD